MRITVPMYEKGRSFLMAGGLVKAYGGHKFVYIHLLCQGFENICKAMLLAADYEKFGPLLKSKFGHDLEILLDEVKQLYGQTFLTETACAELSEVNRFYKKHQLRYGDDVDYSSFSSDLAADHLHRELIIHLESLNQKFEEIEHNA